MSCSHLSRRDFLQKTALGASALVLGAAASPPAHSAADDVVLGFIGVGGRGTALLRKMVDIEGVRVTTVCDLIDYRVKQAQKIAEGALA